MEASEVMNYVIQTQCASAYQSREKCQRVSPRSRIFWSLYNVSTDLDRSNRIIPDQVTDPSSNGGSKVSKIRMLKLQLRLLRKSSFEEMCGLEV